MLIQTIYKKAIDAGYSAEIVQYNSGKYAVCVDGFGTVEFYNSMERLYKRSNVHIDLNIYSKTVVIMTSEDYIAHKTYNDNKTNIINVFWQAIHAGKNQHEAKAIQREYAINHNCIDIFNSIYA